MLTWEQDKQEFHFSIMVSKLESLYLTLIKMAKKITLSILERLQLPTLLLRSGRMIEMEIVQQVREHIRFTPQEIEQYELRDLASGGVAWNNLKAKEREFLFEDSVIRVIQKGIELADQNEQITQHNLALAKRIQEIKVAKKDV